jgi:hypothetical protein
VRPYPELQFVQLLRAAETKTRVPSALGRLALEVVGPPVRNVHLLAGLAHVEPGQLRAHAHRHLAPRKAERRAVEDGRGGDLALRHEEVDVVQADYHDDGWKRERVKGQEVNAAEEVMVILQHLNGLLIVVNDPESPIAFIVDEVP